MSEVEQQAADILLPSASISLFSKDPETLSSAAALKDDWRFARVNVQSIEGDVDAAVEALQKGGSPELLIIQTDEINDQFTASLGDLSNYCDEGTTAIVIGPVNDIDLYRQLIDMGVSDYLVRPIKPEVLSDVISKALIKRLGVSDSNLIAFIGAKGGVGTSSIAQICAWLASDNMDHATVLMDAAGSWSPLSVGIGFDPATSLSEFSRAVEAGNEDAMERMFFEASEKLSILATGADAMLDPSITPQQYDAILDNIMAKSPVVLVDLSSAENAIKKVVLARAHQIVVVTTPTVTSLRFCRSLLKEISDIRGGESGCISLVVNNDGTSKANEVPNADITEALELEPSASIGYLPSLFLKYESDIKEILSDKDGGLLVTAFLPILQKTLSSSALNNIPEDEKNSGVLGGFLNKFTTK